MKLPFSTDRRLLLLVCGLTVIVAVALAITQKVQGNDPEDAPDSAFVAQGPIADQNTFNDSMAAKTAIVAQDEKDRQAALNGPAGSKDPADAPGLPANLASPTPWVGIINDPGPMETGWGRVYRLENRWVGYLRNDLVSVVAGSLSDDPTYGTWNDPQQGVVLVKSSSLDNQQYLTPTRTGSVHVSSVTGTCLTLTSTSNTTYQFDVSTQDWSCAPPGPPNP